MKKSSWLVTLILVIAASVLAATSIYGFDWFGMKKVQPSVKIPTPAEAGIKAVQPGMSLDPLKMGHMACAEAYKKIKDGLAGTKSRLDPFCQFTALGGHEGDYFTSTAYCFAASAATSEPAYPIYQSIHGSPAPTSLDTCMESARPAGWSPACVKTSDIAGILRPILTNLTDAGWTWEWLMGETSEVNRESNSFYGPFFAPPRVPYFELAPSSGMLGATRRTEIMAFRTMAGYECARDAYRFLSDGKAIICVDENIQEYESGCR